MAQEPNVPPTPAAGPQPSNRLARETSPYLRQHAHNPVDWYPWGPEALARAAEEDKPIFLSIGYSACHWCHVMAHESFADPAVAAVMNANFVCIKVDREERPDLDEVYMAALQAMGQQGGWPLSAWLLPDGRPFYAGTYFPPQDSHGRPGFRRVCEHLAKAWREQRQELVDGADRLTTHLQQVLAPELPPGEPTAAMLATVLPDAERRFDAAHGGFAPAPAFAPKFPPPRQLQVLLRLGGEPAAALVRTTLDAMQQGGMFDQLGGGFHRYSTDRAWIVPHFEKMLYDNALLVPCYLEAAALLGEREYAATARRTLDYLLREMQHPGGAFFASQDAQSEGVEGRFFVWSRSQFTELLGDDADLAARFYGVTEAGNWDGHNVLVRAASGPLSADAAARLERARQVLFAARDRRVHPGTDDKLLCSWNGLAITAKASGYRHLGDARYLAAARAAADFVLRELVVDGRCRRSWHSGKAPQPGFLDDQALLAEGLLALFEVDSDARWLTAARDLLRTMQAQFGADDGSFWFTAADEPTMVARTKSAFESATPSGTAAAAGALLRAGLLLGDEPFYEAGVATLRSQGQLIVEAPSGVPSLVLALQFHLADPREIVVVGAPDDPRTEALLAAARRLPEGRVTILHLHDGNREALTRLTPLVVGKVEVDGAPAAYVCRRGTCEAPVTDPERLATL
ncbi:MAG: thioredoxin domain-containing protein [Planctomycetes bacterium]|nr:thioredoxin domain-containing protein [Planctomycetota bacterium]